MKRIVHLNDDSKIEVDVAPCPFCGGQPCITHIGNSYTNSQSILFSCPSCRIQRKNSAISMSIECCINKSVEQWNMRKTPNKNPLNLD